MQMSMNARPLSLTSATPTPCVIILKDPTRVVVVEDIPETEGHVQVMHIVKTFLRLPLTLYFALKAKPFQLERPSVKSSK